MGPSSGITWPVGFILGLQPLPGRQRLLGENPALPGSATILLRDLGKSLPSLSPSCEMTIFPPV